MLLQAGSLDELIESGQGAERSGDWDEAIAHYQAALVAAAANDDFARAATVLRAIGRLHFERGDYDRAAEAFTLSLQRAEAAGDVGQTAAALNCSGVVEQYRGRIEAAAHLYAQAADLAARTGDKRLGALTEQNLGTLATLRGDYDIALEHGQNALAMFRSLGDDLAAARVLNNIGMLQLDTQQLGHADLSFRSAFTLAERMADTALRVKIQANRAELALARQDYDAAHELCAEAFQAYTRLGSESGLSDTYRLYGVLYRETKNPQLAATHFRLAARLAQACGDTLLEAESERERATLEMEQGRHRDALSALNHAHRLFDTLSARREVADIERKLERVERMYLRVVEMLESEITLTFDAPAVEQYQRVARYAVQLARVAGFTGRDLTWLRIGAFLYDIGKRSVPLSILNKRGPLDAEEWEAIKQHVLDSEKVVIDLDPPWDMRPMVRHHHEHWDGTGYPDNLSGDDIPLAARILCIVDAFTALTAKRSYRAKMDNTAALDLMAQQAGHIFDPTLFGSFRTLIENEDVAQ